METALKGQVDLDQPAIGSREAAISPVDNSSARTSSAAVGAVEGAEAPDAAAAAPRSFNPHLRDPEAGARAADQEPMETDHRSRDFGRYPSASALQFEIEVVRGSGLFDVGYYTRVASPPAGIDPIEHYLLVGHSLGFKPVEYFDPDFYSTYYPGWRNAFVDAFVHYAANHRNEFVFPNPARALRRLGSLRESGYFDEQWYRDTYLRDHPDLDPLVFYAARGWREGHDPSPRFSARAYLAEYEAVARRNVNPLRHFLANEAEREGAASFDPAVTAATRQPGESRYRDAETLAREVDVLRRSGLLDEDYYRTRYSLPLGMDPVEHYLSSGFHLGHKPRRVFDFDASFYTSYYPDWSDGFVDPYVHYAANRHREGVFPNLDRAAGYIGPLQGSDLFDRDWYEAKYLGADSGLDPLTYFMLSGWRQGHEPSPKFSGRFYTLRYKDIALAGINPLRHFVTHGRMQGRVVSFDADAAIREGGLAYRPELPTVVVCCHEASRTGAPILGLNLLWRLAPSVNVVAWIVGQGELLDDFRQTSVAVVDRVAGLAESVMLAEALSGRFRPDFAVLNSVETAKLLDGFHSAGIPTVMLVHEFADYTFPRGRVARALAYADIAVFPARTVRAAAFRELDELLVPGMPANVVVRPQGRCELPRRENAQSVRALGAEQILDRIRTETAERPFVVLGLGHIHARKGVDVFIAAARWLRRHTDRPFRFVWVGGGYFPEKDLHYSAWLKSEVLRSGLEDRVFFFPEQESLDGFWEVADALFLSSRLDPFPNVAVDALSLGVPVVCFEGATGIADLAPDFPELIRAVPHLEMEAAAAELLAMAESQAGRWARSAAAAERFRERFHLDAYVAELRELGARARESRRAAADEAERLAARGLFEADFFDAGLPQWAALPPALKTPLALLEQYVAFARKGLHLAKPRAGFNDAAWPAAGNADASPLEQAASQAAKPRTHDVHRLAADPSQASEGDAATLKAALHVHLYYEDLAPSMVERLAVAGAVCDLFVTTDAEAKADFIRPHLRAFAGGAAETLVVPNRGRDVGPLLTGLRERLSGYEIIGHLHGKRSPDLGDPGEGWREFLFRVLLGEGGAFARIMALFQADPTLGLLFPEDPAIVGWTRNKTIAADLLARMSPDAALPAHPEFPLGTMFWARRAALAPLFGLGLDWRDYPAEPVAYDGTVLHAIERLLPTVCAISGHRWATLHDPQARRRG